MSEQQGSAKIIEEIRADAASEVAKLNQEAEAIVSRILANAEREAAKIKATIEDETKTKIQQEIERKASKARLEAKMDYLKYRDSLVKKAVDAGYEKAKAILQDKSKAKPVLIQMIKEAVYALESGEFIVGSNETGLKILTKDVLSSIATDLKKEGYEVTFTLASEPIATAGGVIVETVEKDVIVDNTLESVLQREHDRIYTEVSRILFD